MPVKVYFHSLKGENIYTYLHWHTSVEFNLTTSGRILTLISGKKREQMAGEWNVVNSGELHGNYWVQTNDFYEGFTVLFSKNLFDCWLGNDTRFQIPENEEARETIAKSILRFGELDNQKLLESLEGMEQVFHFMVLLKKYCIQSAAKDSKVNSDSLEKLRPILQYLNRHYADSITLSSIAQQFHYTPEHLSRMFKNNAGCNFYQYLQDIRLMHCIDDIKRNVSVNLSDAALNNGFPNVKSFIETFKRHMGCTPSQWLRQLSSSTSKKSALQSIWKPD